MTDTFARQAEVAVQTARTELDAADAAVSRLEELLEQAEVEVAADVLRMIWGANPQAPVSELHVDLLLERLGRQYGWDTAQAITDAANWDVDVPGGEDD